MRGMPTTLKEARQKGKLDEFIKEHEKDPSADEKDFNRTLDRLAQKKKSAPETSKPDSDER